jgi:hypothetical protein
MDDPSCPCCANDDATQASTAWLYRASGIDESHLSVARYACPTCGRQALRIWTELIDWDEGDDSQADIIVPLPSGADPGALEDEGQVAAVLRAIGRCRFLVWCSPRGTHAQATWYWRTDEPIILPHD